MSSAVKSPETDTQFVSVDDPKRRLPGVEGVWVFVMADMTVFAVMFGSFMLGRHHDPALFEASRHALNPNFGGVNTLILLTSSWFAALALDAVRKSRFGLAQHFIGAAFLCGVAFMVSKAIEYTEKLNAGISLLTNDFFMYYFTLTGIHLFHVVAGNGAARAVVQGPIPVVRPEAARRSRMRRDLLAHGRPAGSSCSRCCIW
jgi:nitric oxide reductase NorE protein